MLLCVKIPSKYYQKTNQFFLYFFLYLKMTKNYYQKHKVRLQKEVRKRYQTLSEEEKKNGEKRSRKESKSFWGAIADAN